VLSLGGRNGLRHGFLDLALDAATGIGTKTKETAGGGLSLHACRISPEGQAGSRQIDSFNSFEARKATFLLALI
jgi:hypothetical protein